MRVAATGSGEEAWKRFPEAGGGVEGHRPLGRLDGPLCSVFTKRTNVPAETLGSPGAAPLQNAVQPFTVRSDVQKICWPPRAGLDVNWRRQGLELVNPVSSRRLLVGSRGQCHEKEGRPNEELMSSPIIKASV